MTEALQEYKEKPGTCSACGNSPVNHLEAYCAYTTSVWIAMRQKPSMQRSRFDRLSRAMSDRIAPVFSACAHALRLVRFSGDHTRARTYRSQVVWEEALRRNIKMEQLVIFGSYTELYRARIADRWEYFESIPVPARLESGNASLIDDKFLIKQHLRTNGVPTPRTLSVRTENETLAAFREIGVPVTVKPRAGSRGRHTTTNIRTEEELLAAFRLAKKLCRYVAIEEHLSGSVCRATLVGGTLAGFLQGDPPRVVGNGHQSIRDLVIRRNKEKPERVQEIVLGEEHERSLARQGYTVDSIPSTGTRIDLTHRTGRLFGGETRELLHTVHPKMREYLERAAELLKTPVVGLDLIIEDPESDPDMQRWGVIEANSLPYIDLHYLPLHGEPSNVASAVWDLWEKPTL